MEAPEEDEREPFLDPRAPSAGRATCWPSTRLLGPESPPAPGSRGSLAPGVDASAPAGRGGSSVSAPTAHGGHNTQWAAPSSRITLGRLPHETLSRPKNSCQARSRDASPGVSTGTEQTAVSPQGLNLNPGEEKDSSLDACPQPQGSGCTLHLLLLISSEHSLPFSCYSSLLLQLVIFKSTFSLMELLCGFSPD